MENTLKEIAKGEITKWRILPKESIDKEKYSEIFKGFIILMEDPETTEYAVPEESVMLEGIMSVVEDLGYATCTSYLRNAKKEDGVFYVETKSGSIYSFRKEKMDWLMKMACVEIIQYGTIEMSLPKPRF